MAKGLCATTEVCNRQSRIEIVQVRVQGKNDWALEHCLQFCVYRLKPGLYDFKNSKIASRRLTRDNFLKLYWIRT